MGDSTTNTLTELPILPVRAADSHKGDYGKVLLVGGSRGMSGAYRVGGNGLLAIRSRLGDTRGS